MKKVEFLEDYKQFKKGQFLQFPDKLYTGQVNLTVIWKEIDELLDKGVVRMANNITANITT